MEKTDVLVIEYLKNNLLSRNAITAAVLEKINDVMCSCNLEPEKYIIFLPFSHQMLNKTSNDYVYHILSRDTSPESLSGGIAPMCQNKFAHFKKPKDSGEVGDVKIKMNASNSSIRRTIGEEKSVCLKCMEINDLINEIGLEEFSKIHPGLKFKTETTENLYLRVVSNNINRTLANDYMSFNATPADKSIALYGEAHKELLKASSEDFLLYSISWSILSNYISVHLSSMIVKLENSMNAEADAAEINRLYNYIKNMQLLNEKLCSVDYQDYSEGSDFPIVTLGSQPIYSEVN